jgi:hypothetical protein
MNWMTEWGLLLVPLEDIDKLITGEPVKDKDVVFWYGAHVKHDENHKGGVSHIVGPDLRPVRRRFWG